MKFAFLPCSREEIFAQVLLNVLYFVYVYIYIYIYQSHSSCIKTVPLFPCLKYEQSLLISSQASAKPKKILWCIQKNSTPLNKKTKRYFSFTVTYPMTNTQRQSPSFNRDDALLYSEFECHVSSLCTRWVVMFRWVQRCGNQAQSNN